MVVAIVDCGHQYQKSAVRGRHVVLRTILLGGRANQLNDLVKPSFLDHASFQGVRFPNLQLTYEESGSEKIRHEILRYWLITNLNDSNRP